MTIILCVWLYKTTAKELFYSFLFSFVQEVEMMLSYIKNAKNLFWISFIVNLTLIGN